jgi:hypothetical protein
MRFIFAFALFFSANILLGQGTYVPLNSYTQHQIDRLDIKYGKILPIPHTSVKPFNRKMVGEYAESMYNSNIDQSKQLTFNLEYLLNDNTEWTDSFEYQRKPLWKIFYPEKASMLGVDQDAFIVKVNPVIHLDFGKELGNNMIFTNTRGFELRSYIKKKLGFYTYIGENQVRFLSYIRDERIGRTHAHVPGDGYWKTYRGNAQDFFTARGYMTFNVIEHLDFQFGYDKNFIGNGYRSLFLSDNANAYLFLKMNIKVWRINYQSIFTELVGQYNRGGDRLLDKKYAVFHHLNFNVTNWLDIGIFESVVFSRSNHFELHYLNPLIFYRSIEQDLGSPDNVFVGLDYKANIFSSFSLYGQALISEFNFANLKARNGWWANKMAFQQGLKYIDVAGVDNLDVQLEFNMARPYIYAHKERGTSQLANYTHYNQELAHPFGANFREFITIVRYQPPVLPGLSFQMEFMHGLVGRDTAGIHYGSDIFRVTNANTAAGVFGNKVGQGNKNRINYVNLMASYQFWHNMFADFSLGVRKLNTDIPELNSNSVWLSGGVRINTGLRRNMY